MQQQSLQILNLNSLWAECWAGSAWSMHVLNDLIRIVCICLCLRAQGAEVACRGRTKARHKQGQEADECMQGTCIITLVASIASGAMEVHDVVREMVDAVLSAEFMAPLSQWKTIVGIFEENGLAWKQNLEASCLLVHPANRSGLGVNSHAVHAKGSALWHSGFDSKYLHSSTCCLT